MTAQELLTLTDIYHDACQSSLHTTLFHLDDRDRVSWWVRSLQDVLT